MGGRGWAHTKAGPWVPISSPFTHMVYHLPFLSNLACSKSVSAGLSDPDAMRNTALEAKLRRAAKMSQSVAMTLKTV